MPVLIPARHGDLDGLVARCERLQRGRPALPRRPDPRPDPFRLHRSIVRYHELRRRLPEAEILMGIGNLTELTDADTTGITMTLMGMVSELRDPQHPGGPGQPALPPRGARGRAGAPHHLRRARPTAACRKATTPACWRCATAGPFPTAPAEIAAIAARGRRPQLPHRGRRGRHPRLQPRRPSRRRATRSSCSRSWRRAGRRPRLLPRRRDGAGADRAQLGKRYVQDNELRWGCRRAAAGRGSAHSASRRQHAGAPRKSRRQEG